MLSCVVILNLSCIFPERYVTSSSQEQQKEPKFHYQKTLDTTDNSGIRYKGGDGSSMENAIIITGRKMKSKVFRLKLII
jgi:hypothetical protein